MRTPVLMSPLVAFATGAAAAVAQERPAPVTDATRQPGGTP
jgi:hypothetical protein